MRTRLGDWLGEAPYTLALSAGFFGFFAHAGVLAALEEARLAPARVTGASAGALAGGLWSAGLPAAQLKSTLFSLKRQDFWDPGPGLGLLRGRRFRDLLARLSPIERLVDCVVPFAASVLDGLRVRTVVPREWGFVEAVYASCAVPFLFHPLFRNGRPYWDGGIRDRAALAGVGRGERVLSHWLQPVDGGPGLPRKAGRAVVAVPGLPRPGPDDLAAGRLAWERARAGFLRALEAPVAGAVS
jgi:NTE family protein